MSSILTPLLFPCPQIFDMSHVQPFAHQPDEIMRLVTSMCPGVAVPHDRTEMYGNMLLEGGALAWLGSWQDRYVQTMMSYIHPSDHKLDKTFKFALYLGGAQDRYFEWERWNTEACEALSIFRQSGFEFSVHSRLPSGYTSLLFRSIDLPCSQVFHTSNW